MGVVMRGATCAVCNAVVKGDVRGAVQSLQGRV